MNNGTPDTETQQPFRIPGLWIFGILLKLAFPIWYSIALATGRAGPIEHWMAAIIMFVFVGGVAIRDVSEHGS